MLGYVAEFRETNATTPVVLMGYANPIEAMGVERFADAAQRPASTACWSSTIRPRKRDAIVATARRARPRPDLPAVADDDRRAAGAVAALGRGYLYYVSLKGVTGAAHLDLDDVAQARSRASARIRSCRSAWASASATRETARRIAGVADAVVIGSRLVQEIESAAAGRGGTRA